MRLFRVWIRANTDKKILMDFLRFSLLIIIEEFRDLLLLTYLMFLNRGKGLHKGRTTLPLVKCAAPNALKDFFPEPFGVFEALLNEIADLVYGQFLFQFFLLSLVFFHKVLWSQFRGGKWNSGTFATEMNVFRWRMSQQRVLLVHVLQFFSNDALLFLLEELGLLFNEVVPVVLNFLIREGLVFFLLLFVNCHFVLKLLVDMFIGVPLVLMEKRFYFLKLGLDVGEFWVFQFADLGFLLAVGNLRFNVLVDPFLDVLQLNRLLWSFYLRIRLLHEWFRIVPHAFCWVRRNVFLTIQSQIAFLLVWGLFICAA